MIISRRVGITRLFVMAAALALALTTLGAASTLASNESRIVFVNGIPSASVDICLNGKQVISGLRSAGVTSRVLDNGSFTLKAFRKDARRCKGVKLAQKTVSVRYQDLTVVITKKAPKVVIFDNGIFAETGPSNDPTAVIVIRDASDLGLVTIKSAQVDPIAPSSDPIWSKGDTYFTVSAIGATWGVFATRPNQTGNLARPKFQVARDQTRHEWVLIGTRGKNARIVAFSRAFWLP